MWVFLNVGLITIVVFNHNLERDHVQLCQRLGTSWSSLESLSFFFFAFVVRSKNAQLFQTFKDDSSKDHLGQVSQKIMPLMVLLLQQRSYSIDILYKFKMPQYCVKSDQYPAGPASLHVID